MKKEEIKECYKNKLTREEKKNFSCPECPNFNTEKCPRNN
jgi:hypothetical protein